MDEIKMLFRRRPAVVEAIQWTGDNLAEIFTLTGRISRDSMPLGQIGIWSPLPSASSYRIANKGDWVVRSEDGDVRPMTPDAFTALYERTGTIDLTTEYALIQAGRAVVDAAKAYRQAETDSTPRMWRGKDLHDLALILDDAITECERCGEP